MGMSSKINSFLIFLSLLFFGFTLSFSPCTAAEEGVNLQSAQWLYQHENYEEALVLFKELSAKDPQSAEISYYLGLTYKRMQDYTAARSHLEAAAVMQPNVKNAFLELIDIFYQCDELEQAKKWISMAENESISSAQLDFLKGLVFLKEGTDISTAIKSFEEAEKKDPSLSQSVRFQKALAEIKLNNLKDAKEIFKEVIAREPETDLAVYADEYVTMLTRSEEAKKPLHGSFGYFLEYDNNVVLKPNNDALAASVSEDSDWRNVFTAQADYNFKPTDKLGFKAGYSFYSTKQDKIGFYDTMSHDFSLQPTLYFEKMSVAFPLHYNYVSVDDRKYLEVIGVSNLNNIVLNKNQMLQLLLQYSMKDYQWAPLTYDDKKTGEEYLFSAGWFYLFGRNSQGLFNLRYALNYEDTKGNNWGYLGNRFTLTGVFPIVEKLKWNIVLDYFRQDFRKENTTYKKTRKDDIFTAVNLLGYELAKNTEVQLKHVFVYDGASIGIYKYSKHVYSLGLKYRF
jgi:tetratricopeptide (TPR) repeat protein